MTAKEKAAKIAKLKKQIAALEAQLGGLREDLARLEREAGDTSPLSGLDMLWEAALPKSRERSSRQKCRLAWARIPKGERPRIEVAVAALRAWNRCEQWTRDNNQFAIGLDRFISERRWEDVPQVKTVDPLARYRPANKPVTPAPQPEELATADDVAEILGSLTRSKRTTDQP